MEPKKSLVTKQKEHPLEDAFDIEPGTTVIQYEQQTTELVSIETYDEKDEEIESQIQEIADRAISGYERLQDEMDGLEGKYLARTAEVSNQFLGRALDAIKEKARMKENKDKLIAKSKAPPKTVNNTLVMTQSELLESLRKPKKDESE